MARVTFTVNGATHTVETPPMARLLDVFRHNLALTGTKEGCGEGECGACSVLLDGLLRGPDRVSLTRRLILMIDGHQLHPFSRVAAVVSHRVPSIRRRQRDVPA